MLDHLATDYNVEHLIDRDFVKMLEVGTKKPFRARFLQNINTGLVVIEAVDFARGFFQVEMEQHILGDRILGVGVIGAAKMQNLFAATEFLDKIDSLNKAETFVHRQIEETERP